MDLNLYSSGPHIFVFLLKRKKMKDTMTPSPVVFQKPSYFHWEAIHFSTQRAYLEYFLQGTEVLYDR